MTISFQVSENTEAAFQRAFGENLDRAALEAMCIEGYRAGKLSLGEVAAALGLETTIIALEWLGKRGVAINYSIEDFEADQGNLARVLGDRRA